MFVAAILFLAKGRLPPEIPLFYGNPRGEGQLAQRWAIVVPSLVAVAAVLVNTALSGKFKDRLVVGVLRGVIVVLTILSIITTVKVVSIVGSF